MISWHSSNSSYGCRIFEFHGVRGFLEFYIVERGGDFVGVAGDWKAALIIAYNAFGGGGIRNYAERGGFK